ncbi:glycosyltransferase [Hyphococcus sp.]|uniref:glycosyltransferase n=1 Tax=Hyphococcus sp. TaxID=2038636 RepID=UPI003CCBA607
MSRFIILIPAYEPDETLVHFIDDLLREGAQDAAFAEILVIDDGSTTQAARAAFASLKTHNQVKLVAHQQNMGKGAALKTGFREIHKTAPADVRFVVTADADGQHVARDVFKLARQAIASGAPNIGYRNFTGEAPLRSRFGNLVTAAIFRVAIGQQVYDTQSGLRTYRRSDLTRLCAIPANRYEFEFHCLFEMVKNTACGFEQIPIETVYEPGNPTSHFNPFLDSFRIYVVFLRYVSVSAFSGALDFLFFTILTLFNLPTLWALIVARIATAPIYFYGMRNIVFKSDGDILLQAAGTVALMALHIIFLWRFINWLETSFAVNPIGAMLAGLLLFYALNFLVQRYIIYPRRRHR